jgi:hypothetical protein
MAEPRTIKITGAGYASSRSEYEKRAREYEEKAKLVTDPWIKERYVILAKRCL